MRKLFILFLLSIGIQGNCQEGFTYPYFLISENAKFYMKSIPHEAQLYQITGRTDVFRTSDSALLYSINRYFAPDGIVFGNDGTSVLYTRYNIRNDENFDETILLFYKNGKIERTYTVDQLVAKNAERYSYSLFYQNSKAYHWENGARKYQDTVKECYRKILEDQFVNSGNIAFMATRDNEILQFDLNLGTLISRKPILECEAEINKYFNKQTFVIPSFERSSQMSLPLLADGSDFLSSFEKKFDLSSDGYDKDAQFKYYELDLYCLINKYGNCEKAYVECEDSAINKDIENFILSLKFDPDAVSEILEKWYFRAYFSIRKTDKDVSMQERIAEKEQKRINMLWRIQQDTLDGFYIPKDIYDCFSELDKVLYAESKRKQLSSSLYYSKLNLGSYVRNNWGLWTGSRLQAYFRKLGITEADKMSVIILNSYYSFSNNKPICFEEQIERYRIPPNPLLQYRPRIKLEPVK